MKNSLPRRLVFLLGLAVVAAFAQPAAAQIGPNPYYYGGWGGYPDTSATYNTMMSNVSQQRIAGENQAAAQRAAVQSGIRSTLSNQANTWTQASVNRQQDTQDWWWQVQQQQLAQKQARRAQPTYQPPPASAPAFEPSTTTAAMVAEPARASDIIHWLPILYDHRFDALRAEVEAPYLRNGGKTLSQPTAADYHNMIKAFEQMKVVLKQMDTEIAPRQYLDTCQDLDGLIKQASDRAARLEAAQPKK